MDRGDWQASAHGVDMDRGDWQASAHGVDMDRGDWQASAHGVAKPDRTERVTLPLSLYTKI